MVCARPPSLLLARTTSQTTPPPASSCFVLLQPRCRPPKRAARRPQIAPGRSLTRSRRLQLLLSLLSLSLLPRNVVSGPAAAFGLLRPRHPAHDGARDARRTNCCNCPSSLLVSTPYCCRSTTAPFFACSLAQVSLVRPFTPSLYQSIALIPSAAAAACVSPIIWRSPPTPSCFLPLPLCLYPSLILGWTLESTGHDQGHDYSTHVSLFPCITRLRLGGVYSPFHTCFEKTFHASRHER